MCQVETHAVANAKMNHQCIEWYSTNV